MKKTVIVVLLTLLCLMFSIQCRTPLSGQTLEAEQAALRDSCLVQTDLSAGGDSYVWLPEKRGSICFEAEVEEAGRYALFIAYKSPGADNAQHILINHREYAPEIGFSACDTWTEIRHPAGLQKGKNKIELKASWGNMAVDYLRIEGPVFDPPEITPVMNTWTRNCTAEDISIQVNKNHNRLINVTCGNDTVPFMSEPVWYLEDAEKIIIPAGFIRTLETGMHRIRFNFETIKPLVFQLSVKDTLPAYEWTVVSLDVRHGTSVMMCMPTGKHLLIDTGTKPMCEKRVIPFLDRQRIDLDYLWITHHHPDHEGGRNLLAQKYPDLVITDNDDYNTDDRFEFEGIQCLILNSAQDGAGASDENIRSLSIRMEYQGFVYTHGGDIYGMNQRRISEQYAKKNQSGLLKTHVYHANHHFHGSVDVDYLREIDPCLILVSGEEHIYGRGAYTQKVQLEVLQYLRNNSGRLIEDLLPFEVGHVLLRIHDKDAWHYETRYDIDAKICL